MDYIDKLRLKAFLYRINCGLLFDATMNITDFKDLTADDAYSKTIMQLPGATMPIPNFNLALCTIGSYTNLYSQTVVEVGYENNKLIIKEKIWKQHQDK
jgi:hypothetical protein